MKNILFTSDTHLDHGNIIKYCNRPFGSAKEMTEALTDYWNETASPNDEIYHMGDFAFVRDQDKLDALVKKLNGTIYLILGNHDNRQLCERAFNGRVYSSYSLRLEGTKVVMCHFPYAVWDQRHYGSWHLYGHCHGHYVGAGRSFDCGVDSNGFKPLHYEEVKARMESLPIITF